MSLLVLAYHRASAGRHGNSPGMLDRHFRHIAERHPVVLPGENLQRGMVNVCLTFDDATFDFHSIVYPLLKKHGLKAVLGVPAGFIRESSPLTPAQRESVPSETAFADPASGGFCTWDELREMGDSGRVEIAAHGYTHVRLDHTLADLDVEICVPRTLLSARLGRPIGSFIFPYGRFNSDSLSIARQHYKHIFRIGEAINRHWKHRLLYRVGGDRLLRPDNPFLGRRLAAYRFRWAWNKLRTR